MKIFWKRGEIAHDEQFFLLATIFCYLLLDLHVETRTRFPLRDKRLFEITEVEITRVDCRWMMDDLRFYVLSISISVISGRWADDYERLCSIEPC